MCINGRLEHPVDWLAQRPHSSEVQGSIPELPNAPDRFKTNNKPIRSFTA